MLFHVEIGGDIVTDEPLAFAAAQDLMMQKLSRTWGRLVRVN
ncbi:hypothetical protein [Tritonibacter mobilis]|nr:hypothetical protein [Tritonibacter mobilis]